MREVEEKLENGVIVAGEGGYAQGAYGIEAGPGYACGDGASVGGQKAPLPKAIPDDIRKIVTKWPSIVGNADNPMKQYLKTAKLSLGTDNRLLMVLEDGLTSDYFTQHPENKEMLERMLSDFSGKEVEVTIQTVTTRQEFEQNYVDLSQVIHMEIEEED